MWAQGRVRHHFTVFSRSPSPHSPTPNRATFSPIPLSAMPERHSDIFFDRTMISQFRLSLFALFVSFALLAAAPAQAQDATRTVSETVDLDADGSVSLKAFTGSIEITTWDRESVDIEVRIEGDDQELVDMTAIRIDGSGRRVTIETDYDDVEDEQKFMGLFNFGDADKPATHYTIQMPRGADLSIEDFSSKINVSDLQADLSINTFSSTIRLRGIEGRLSAETFSSSFRADEVRGSIDFETFSGDATIRFAALTGDSQFESFSGDVELYLPEDATFDLDAEMGMSGSLESDFDLTVNSSGDNEQRGRVGEGGPEIAFETFSGDLELRKR